jgi:hypothetical protein
VEPPASLVPSILASTTGVDTQRLRTTAYVAQPRVSWLEHVQASFSGFLEPIWATVRQPRFAMSFGMAFFALSVGLTVLGVKPSDLRSVSLRPAAIRHTYYETQARVRRYYENMRVVYEVESLARQVRRNVAPAEPEIQETRPAKPKDDKNDTTQQPEQRQERNYSQSDNQLILAGAHRGPFCNGRNACDLPVVSVTTYRRFV